MSLISDENQMRIYAGIQRTMIGQAPNLTPAELEFVKPLSTPGKLCIYHVDIPSKPGEVITYVAIQNPTTSNEIKLEPTTTVVIGVNEIVPLPSGSEGNMTMSK